MVLVAKEPSLCNQIWVNWLFGSVLVGDFWGGDETKASDWLSGAFATVKKIVFYCFFKAVYHCCKRVSYGLFSTNCGIYFAIIKSIPRSSTATRSFCEMPASVMMMSISSVFPILAKPRLPNLLESASTMVFCAVCIIF